MPGFAGPPGSRGDTWRSHESESQKMDAQTILQVEVSLSQGFGTGIVLVHTGSIYIYYITSLTNYEAVYRGSFFSLESSSLIVVGCYWCLLYRLKRLLELFTLIGCLHAVLSCPGDVGLCQHTIRR